jgi:hypothetical protein
MGKYRNKETGPALRIKKDKGRAEHPATRKEQIVWRASCLKVTAICAQCMPKTKMARPGSKPSGRAIFKNPP